MAMLEVKDLEVYYGVIQAIKGISFEVNKGEVIALIGANGAGKTTTLHTITGLLSPKKGQVIFEGKDITKVPAHKIVSMGMCFDFFDWKNPGEVSQLNIFGRFRTFEHTAEKVDVFLLDYQVGRGISD